MTVRELAVGDVPVRALRVTFVGELGWELYCPTEYGAGAVARALGGRASRTACVAGGYRAIDTLRLEKGYRVWGGRHHARRDALRGAGSGFCVKLDKPAASSAATRSPARRAGPARRLCCLLLDDPRAVALGNEPVRGRAARSLGRVTSGGYGYTVERSIAYAYLPAEHAEPGTRRRGRRLRRLGRRARSPPSRCSDPRGDRIRGG